MADDPVAGDPAAGDPVAGDPVAGDRAPSASVRQVCAVLGRPIEHSLSPVLHTAGYRALSLDGWEYRRIDCGEADLAAIVSAMGPPWRGLSVTMPGKRAAAQFADEHSVRVDRLGVANTLVHRADGGWVAENTDVDGVLGALAAHRVPVGGRALVLGGGGTALAVIAALAERGVAELVVAGRRPGSRAEGLELAGELGIPASGIDFEARAIAEEAPDIDLVISAVPAGAADHLADIISGVPALLDVTYHPWPTPLVTARTAAIGEPAESRESDLSSTKGTVVTGLDLLLHQALRQFELFTGMRAPAPAMRDALVGAVPNGPELPLTVRG